MTSLRSLLSSVDIHTLDGNIKKLYDIARFTTNTPLASGTTFTDVEVKYNNCVYDQAYNAFRNKVKDIIALPPSREVEQANKDLLNSKDNLDKARDRLKQAADAINAVADFAAVFDSILGLIIPLVSVSPAPLMLGQSSEDRALLARGYVKQDLDTLFLNLSILFLKVSLYPSTAFSATQEWETLGRKSLDLHFRLSHSPNTLIHSETYQRLTLTIELMDEALNKGLSLGSYLEESKILIYLLDTPTQAIKDVCSPPV
jgi:hypothetical protein